VLLHWCRSAPQAPWGWRQGWLSRAKPRHRPLTLLSLPFRRTQKRVAEFTRFLNSRSEKVIVCVGHSTFWKVFSNDKTRLKNCEVKTMLW
jgi:hypothetical protein